MSTDDLEKLTNKLNNIKRNGKIEVIFGPMFSGKSTELMRRVRRYEIANYSCVVVKYAHDTRYDDENLSTHDRILHKAVSATRLEDIRDQVECHEVIAVDEGQFFPDCVTFCEQMADLRKIIIVAALDGTYQRKAFGDILNLIPLAESVVKLTAVCNSCFAEASYTKRIGQEKELEVIGGAEMYMAVCRVCHAEPLSRADPKNLNSPVKAAH